MQFGTSGTGWIRLLIYPKSVKVRWLSAKAGNSRIFENLENPISDHEAYRRSVPTTNDSGLSSANSMTHTPVPVPMSKTCFGDAIGAKVIVPNISLRRAC